ncbi:hypothetical protein HCN44_003249 [Aphidius gifuensis]|uniref:PUM-HD domain-containing protein n=1 Tax=Aphidius gifuensis TaxID=684658 RepID=A0A834XKV0_APHGI|nr:pumilio homolog 3 [Aphidius gifuensis]KAF7987487.1 hypothetical protein HCN44_003249 [Aphidius gifuensis]
MKRELSKDAKQENGNNKKFKKSIDNNKSTTDKKPKFEKKNVGKFNNNNKKKPQNGMNGPATTVAGEKPDWQKFKKEKKDLKEKRRVQKLENVYDIAVKAKKIEEKLRRSDCIGDKKIELTNELYKLLDGKFEKLIFTHDLSRTIQWLIKFSTDEKRQSIFNEVKAKTAELFHSKYAKNCLKKFLKYGNDNMRQEILLGCSGHVVELVSNVVSGPLIDTAYRTWANDETKNIVKQEFYGGMYKNSKDKNIKTLVDVYAKSTDMKTATLSAVKMNLIRVMNKNAIGNSIVHTILSEFLSQCNDEDRAELIVMLRDSIYELSTTKDGAEVALNCIWHGTTKDRKLSLKSMKEHVKDIAISEYGHIILMACFDSIDDTTLMKKILFPELINNLNDIVNDEHGKKVLLYLVARRDSHNFHPSFIQQLEKGDSNTTSKKPADIREKELLEAVGNQLLDAISNEAIFWLGSSSIAMVTLAILKSCNGDSLDKAFKSIADVLTNPDITLEDNKTKYTIVEHPGLHMMFKKLIQSDKNLLENNKNTFGQQIIDKLDDEEIKRWLSFNRGCFLLVLLIENEDENIKNQLINKLKKHAKILKNQKGSGASILLKKIQ